MRSIDRLATTCPQSFQVFSGTLVTAGQAIVEIAAIGARTELGKIGKAIAQG